MTAAIGSRTHTWEAILAIARWYPSPHNSQPLRVRVLDEHRLALYYDLDRGLPAEPFGNLSRRIRYNIHDVGHVLRFRDLLPALHRWDAEHVLRYRALDLPLLFHYGRSDLSVDYYGAVVTPDGVREALFEDGCPARALGEFCLVSFEDADASRHLLVAVELRPGVDARDFDEERLGRELVQRLAARNGDVANACRIASERARACGCSRRTAGPSPATTAA